MPLAQTRVKFDVIVWALQAARGIVTAAIAAALDAERLVSAQAGCLSQSKSICTVPAPVPLHTAA